MLIGLIINLLNYGFMCHLILLYFLFILTLCFFCLFIPQVLSLFGTMPSFFYQFYVFFQAVFQFHDVYFHSPSFDFFRLLGIQLNALFCLNFLLFGSIKSNFLKFFLLQFLFLWSWNHFILEEYGDLLPIIYFSSKFLLNLYW